MLTTMATSLTLATFSVLPIIKRRKDTKLARRVSKEANLAFTVLPILACLSPIPSRVQPALKHAMRKLTLIALRAASSPAILGAHSPRVMVPSWVPAPSLLPGVRKRTIGPVMAAAPSALPDLELVHPKRVRGVRVGVRICIQVRVISSGARVAVAGAELVHEGSLRLEQL